MTANQCRITWYSHMARCFKLVLPHTNLAYKYKTQSCKMIAGIYREFGRKSFFSLFGARKRIMATVKSPRVVVPDYKVTLAFSPIPRVVLYLCTGQPECEINQISPCPARNNRLRRRLVFV